MVGRSVGQKRVRHYPLGKPIRFRKSISVKFSELFVKRNHVNKLIEANPTRLLITHGQDATSSVACTGRTRCFVAIGMVWRRTGIMQGKALCPGTVVRPMPAVCKELSDCENRTSRIMCVYIRIMCVNLPPMLTSHSHVRDKGVLGQVPPVRYMLRCL